MDHTSLITTHEAEFNRMNARLKDLEELGEKSIDKIARIETVLVSHTETIKDQQEQTRAIFALGTSVEHMVTEVKELSNKVEKVVSSISDHEHRIDGIEKVNYSVEIASLKEMIREIDIKPAKKVMGYVDAVTRSVVIAVGLYLLWLITDGRIG